MPGSDSLRNMEAEVLGVGEKGLGSFHSSFPALSTPPWSGALYESAQAPSTWKHQVTGTSALLARYIQAWLAHRLHGFPSAISCCRVLASRGESLFGRGTTMEESRHRTG